MESAMSKQSDAAERGPSKGGRVRTCVGCGERVDVGEARGAPALIRLILGPGGVVAVDPGDGGFGRGAHVHPRPECLAGAVSRGLARAAKGRVHSIHEDPEPAAKGSTGEPSQGLVPLTTVSLARAIRTAMGRRIQGLLRAAVRSQGVAIGADAVTGACQRGEAALVVVACDAAAGADLPEIRRAIAEGRAVAWGDKQQLGAIAGGPREHGVAVMAIGSPTLGAAIAGAVHVVDACASVERGEPVKGQHRGRGGRKERQAQGAVPAQEGEKSENPEAAPVHAARADASPPSSGGDPAGGAQGRRAAPSGVVEQPGSREGAAVSRGERGMQTSESGRLLATAPESGKGGVVGGRWAASGSTGRAPTVDKVAAKRRPRGWVRRIG